MDIRRRKWFVWPLLGIFDRITKMITMKRVAYNIWQKCSRIGKPHTFHWEMVGDENHWTNACAAMWTPKKSPPTRNINLGKKRERVKERKSFLWQKARKLTLMAGIRNNNINTSNTLWLPHITYKTIYLLPSMPNCCEWVSEICSFILCNFHVSLSLDLCTPYNRYHDSCENTSFFSDHFYRCMITH